MKMVLQVKTSIAVALNEVQNEMAGKARIGTARSGKIMVALDSGHDPAVLVLTRMC